MGLSSRIQSNDPEFSSTKITNEDTSHVSSTTNLYTIGNERKSTKLEESLSFIQKRKTKKD